MREISKLLIAGHSINEIVEQLKIPRRTVQRYMSIMFAEDNLLLQRSTLEERLTSINIFRRQVTDARLKLLAIADDPEQDGMTKVHAIELATDFSYGALKLMFNPPEWVARSLSNTSTKANELIQQGKEKQKPLELKLVKGKKELPHHFEVVSSSTVNNINDDDDKRES